MADARACEPFPLAGGPILRIEACKSCGVVSLHFGAATIRMDRGALEAAWTTIGHALAELERRGIGEAAEPADPEELEGLLAAERLRLS
jgi:hypothetical protein